MADPTQLTAEQQQQAAQYQAQIQSLQDKITQLESSGSAKQGEVAVLQQQLAGTQQQLAQFAQAVQAELQRNRQPIEPDPEADRFNQYANVWQQQQDQRYGEVAAQVFRNQRSANRAAAQANPALKPIMDRFGAEVEKMIDAIPIPQQGDAQAYQLACQAVRAQHFDELLTEEVTRRTSPPSTPDEDGTEAAVDETPPPTRRPVAPPPMPVGTTATAPIAAKSKRTKLDAEEQEAMRFLERNGTRFQNEDEYKAFQDERARKDTFGFNRDSSKADDLDYV